MTMLDRILTEPSPIVAIGIEYCVSQGSAILEDGFNTAGQARSWAEREDLPEGTYSIKRRPVGGWETVSHGAEDTGP